MTKTVDGVCADCWGVKDPAKARRWRARTRPLLSDLDSGWLNPLNLLWAVGTLVIALLVLALTVGR